MWSHPLTNFVFVGREAEVHLFLRLWSAAGSLPVGPHMAAQFEKTETLQLLEFLIVCFQFVVYLFSDSHAALPLGLHFLACFLFVLTGHRSVETPILGYVFTATITSYSTLTAYKQ